MTEPELPAPEPAPPTKLTKADVRLARKHARALAKRELNPAVASWADHLMIRKPRAIIIQRNGTIDLRVMRGKYVLRKDEAGVEEAFVAESESRLWLPRTVRRGWVTVYVQGDPEPVTTREPRGMGTVLLGRLIGQFYPSLFRKAMRLPGFLDSKTLTKWLLIAGGLAVAYYLAHTNGWLK